MTNNDDFFLRQAIQLAREGMSSGQGGPFGSVLDNQFIYGEIVAPRGASYFDAPVLS